MVHEKGDSMKRIQYLASILVFAFFASCPAFAVDLGEIVTREKRDEKRQEEQQELQKQFEWWPTDAKPAPVKDEKKGGYWWWPTEPGTAKLWGNRGYVYLYKIIYDYKEEELPPAKPQELRPSLLIKKTIKNVKVLFDFDSAELRDDALAILASAVKTLDRNPEADILITGNCDVRGSENYNLALGKKRALVVKQYMLDKGVPEKRIRILSRGKLDALAPIGDLVGMQRDRNAHFVIAEVEEIMIPAPEEPTKIAPEAKPVEEGKYIVEDEEEVESEPKVATKEYIIQQNDSLWKIAAKYLGSGHRWKTIYAMNKDKIKNPDKLKAGTKIIIPIE